MRLFIIVLCSFILLVPSAMSLTELELYVVENGDVIFIGTTNETSLVLPQGVTLEEGIITGVTSEVTSKIQETWSFTYTLPQSILRVSLPMGTSIRNVSESFIEINDDVLVIVSKEYLAIEYVITSPTAFKQKREWAGLVVIGVFVGWFLYRRMKKKASDIKRFSILLEVVHERQKAILLELKKRGMTKMSVLQRACQIPKASFSRHIQELEKKGLITKKGMGKNKVIEIINR